jgi:hypothetical protein
MKAEEFDKLFDEGKDITHLLDMSSARRPNQELKRVNVDFPLWMVKQLDQESKRLGVTRQSIIKIWLAERLERVRSKEAS